MLGVQAGNVMTRIELSDEQAAALEARAAGEGMTLQAWFTKLAEDALSARADCTPEEAVQRILELQKRVKPDPEGWTVKDYIEFGRP